MYSDTNQAKSGGNAIAGGVNEPNIIADIHYFERKIETAGAPADSHGKAMQRVYASLLAHRRQMLAALRDGRPDAWYEYEHVVL